MNPRIKTMLASHDPYEIQEARTVLKAYKEAKRSGKMVEIGSVCGLVHSINPDGSETFKRKEASYGGY